MRHRVHRVVALRISAVALQASSRHEYLLGNRKVFRALRDRGNRNGLGSVPRVHDMLCPIYTAGLFHIYGLVCVLGDNLRTDHCISHVDSISTGTYMGLRGGASTTVVATLAKSVGVLRQIAHALGERGDNGSDSY